VAGGGGAATEASAATAAARPPGRLLDVVSPQPVTSDLRLLCAFCPQKKVENFSYATHGGTGYTRFSEVRQLDESRQNASGDYNH